MANLVKVRPSRPDLIVYDRNGRRIPYKEEGVQLKRTPFIVGRIREGDLIDLDAKKRATAPVEKTPKKKSGGNS